MGAKVIAATIAKGATIKTTMTVIMSGPEETADEVKEVSSSKPQPEEPIKEVPAPKVTEEGQFRSTAKRGRIKSRSIRDNTVYSTLVEMNRPAFNFYPYRALEAYFI